MNEDESRTPENHPNERHEDKGRFSYLWGEKRGYRDLWLLGITGLVLWALIANGARVDQINAERAANIERACEETNARNKDTIAALDSIPNNPNRSAEEQNAGREASKLLINALVPVRDCQQLVEDSISAEVQ